jgi:beta-N-acetylhexosaminidase
MRTRPLASTVGHTVLVALGVTLVAGWTSSTYHNVPALAASLTVRGASATALATLATNLPIDAKIAEAVAAAGTHDRTVMLTSSAWDAAVSDPGGRQPALVRALVATGRPVMVVAGRDPYDLAHLPGVTTSPATSSCPAIPTADLCPLGHGRQWTVE